VPKEIKVSQPQFTFLNAKNKNTGFVAGFGSGKSFIGTLKTIMKVVNDGIPKVAYYLPTYGDVSDIAYDVFPEVCTMLGHKFEINKKDNNMKIFAKSGALKGVVMFRNMSKPEGIVGYQVGYSLIDETDILPKATMDIAFKKILGRNRLIGEVKHKKLLDEFGKTNIEPAGTYYHPHRKALCFINSIDVAGTPEGYKWFYTRFKEEGQPTDLLVKASTYSNLKNLPIDFIDTLKAEYSDELFEAYVNGEFTNLASGTVYTEFDRTLNDTAMEDDFSSDLHIGIDFNVTAMSAVVHLVKDQCTYAIAEHTDLFDTPELIQVLTDTYQGRNIICYPDSAGTARKSMDANSSDIKLLKQAGFKVRANNKNPAIMDRVNGLNSMFCNAVGHRRAFVNTNKCPKYTSALEQQAYDENTKMPDKKNGHDNKGIDAAGYFHAFMFPPKARLYPSHAKQQPIQNKGKWSPFDD
jgi:hypothetical protein